jgi:glycosyltransferase involved in cell wall biosynthesis
MAQEQNSLTSVSPELSVVIPVYRSASIFPELYRRLDASLSPIVKALEIIAVADGNSDGSADIIADIHHKDPRIKLIELSRNFGHQVAVTAGIDHAQGQLIVVMDDDLEDPPEVIPKLIAKAREGYDLVYGIRRHRQVGIIKRVFYAAFYRIMNSLSAIDIPYDSGDFCLMKRPIVDTLKKMPEKNRFIRGMRCWAGYNQTGVEYDREPRYAGESGYSIRGYFKFAMDGILSFSYRPLTIVTASGFITAAAGFLFALYAFFARLTGKLPADATGWTSLMVGILFLGGVQLLSIGIIGQYIARIYDEVKHRPHYIAKRKIGFAATDKSPCEKDNHD